MQRSGEGGEAPTRRGVLGTLGIALVAAGVLSKRASAQTVSSPSGSVSPGGGPTWVAISSATAATVGYGYLVDTSGGAVTVTLPAAPSVGQGVFFIDAASSFDSNNLTVARNSLPIMGLAQDLTVSTENASFGLIYDGASLGWRLSHA